MLAIFDIPDSVPSPWYSPMLMPFLFTFFGLVFFVGGRLYETQQGKVMKAKWAGVVLLMLGLYQGLGHVLALRDSLYVAMVSPYGKKMMISHYAALLIPLLAGIGAGVWFAWDKRRQSYR